MAMARIYWDLENYQMVEKIFRQSAGTRPIDRPIVHPTKQCSTPEWVLTKVFPGCTTEAPSGWVRQ